MARFVAFHYEHRSYDSISCCNVEEEVLVRLRHIEDWKGSEETFELRECSVDFFCLGEFFGCF